MNDPPILPPGGSLPEPEELLPPVHNPYAPSVVEPIAELASGVPLLPGNYWVALAVVYPLTLLLCAVLPGWGIPALIALVSATIRVPMMRARPRPPGMGPLPRPVWLLLISWVFCGMFGIAAFTAFCVVCFPLGLMTFSIYDARGMSIPVVFGFSGLIGLLVYLFLFRLSLRLSV